MMFSRVHWRLLSAVLSAGFVLSVEAQTGVPSPDIHQVDPPWFGFYGKLLPCDGIPIRAAAVVEDRALTLACGKIAPMLAHLSVARANLVARGAELHLIGKDQPTSALPELHGEQSKSYVDAQGSTTDIDQRTRGVGGLYASCGEENLLGLASDRYRGGSDICTHEFAHDVMNEGLDPEVRQKIQKQYKRSTAKGLWKDHYAAANAQEYFAELSMWYFGAHGEFISANFPAPGAASLRSYDADGYGLLDAIYSGREKARSIHVVPAKVVTDEARSGRGQPSRLVIANNTGQTLKVFWLDLTGNLRSYGEIFAYNRTVYDTYISHVWIFQDISGKTLVRYQANAPDCEAIFHPASR